MNRSRYCRYGLLSTALGALLCCLASVAIAASGAEGLFEAEVSGRQIEGRPISWTKSRVQMILRDGQLIDFPLAEARNVRKTADRFQPYSDSELRARLYGEFGPEFDISGTGHYLVVHPRGERDRWAARFEDLYRSFVHYFLIRGLRLKEPEYPLVAVVWHNQQQYLHETARQGVTISPNVLGYYQPTTNRVYLYDAGGSQGGRVWQQNADTIIHEATHQTAFNVGVHTRFAGCPRWLAEGLGTLFEARGVYNWHEFPNRSDRINRGRLAEYRRTAAQQGPQLLAELVASDRPFQRDPATAYAVSWAFTFYLVETQPYRYTQYLALTAARPSGKAYPESARLADFARIFGDNFPMHQARLSRFIADVN